MRVHRSNPIITEMRRLGQTATVESIRPERTDGRNTVIYHLAGGERLRFNVDADDEQFCTWFGEAFQDIAARRMFASDVARIWRDEN